MKNIHVVLTTHWDREWVQSFEQYRFRLVQLMDIVLDELAKDDELRFMCDGQVVMVQDYLDLRPEMADEVHAHLNSGRLVCGPWYVLADQFLEGDEATIRNLLQGRELASRYGGDPMPVGYVPIASAASPRCR